MSPLTAAEGHCGFTCAGYYLFVYCATLKHACTLTNYFKKKFFKKNTNYCMFSKYVLVLFHFKNVVLHFMKNSSVEIVVIWRSRE